MSGIFYVSVISPISMISNSGIYYVYELLSYPFLILIQKSLYILDGIDIFLFTSSIIRVGKQNENIFKISILTESADRIHYYHHQITIKLHLHLLIISMSVYLSNQTYVYKYGKW